MGNILSLKHWVPTWRAYDFLLSRLYIAILVGTIWLSLVVTISHWQLTGAILLALFLLSIKDRQLYWDHPAEGPHSFGWWTFIVGYVAFSGTVLTYLYDVSIPPLAQVIIAGVLLAIFVDDRRAWIWRQAGQL
ncbi:MAG TPA: hypothetical protein VIH52_04090 [Candidatus Nanoarchaeia archaeon]